MVVTSTDRKAPRALRESDSCHQTPPSPRGATNMRAGTRVFAGDRRPENGDTRRNTRNGHKRGLLENCNDPGGEGFAALFRTGVR